MTTGDAKQGPRKTWTWRGWTVTYGDPGRRWGASARGRGVAGHHSPVGALFALRRWLREPLWPVQ